MLELFLHWLATCERICHGVEFKKRDAPNGRNSGGEGENVV